MIELIAHNLAPIMFTSVMAMLLLGYPVAFTLAAGGLAFFFIGVELSIYAPDQIRLFPNLVEAVAVRTFDLVRGEEPVNLAGLFFVWFSLSARPPKHRDSSTLALRIRSQSVPLLGAVSFAWATFAFPSINAFELTAAAAIVTLLLRAAGLTAGTRPLPQVFEMTARALASAMLILVAARIFGLTFYAAFGHKWLEYFGLPGLLGITLTMLVTILVTMVLPVRAVSRGKAAIREGAAA